MKHPLPGGLSKGEERSDEGLELAEDPLRRYSECENSTEIVEVQQEYLDAGAE
ncbi:hypothetical protein [Salarchaeum japonicum]|uniref:hypothetical protein n=1 Tax=Salarchaeum japonicum TaxID=555573 RepID=UPI001D0B3ABF|nr:hypothetical protein [Salarchaeum japonicum]